MPHPVALVTDSTAMLSRALAGRRDILVVPLQVVMGATAYDEGPGDEPEPTDRSARSPQTEEPGTQEPGTQPHVPAAAGAAATPGAVAAALRSWTPVSTSRPTPAVFAAAYERAVRDGAREVVSIHLSGQMSGTVESAELAAREAAVPVHVVDTRQLGMATGFAVLAAADVLDAGGSAEEAVRTAQERSRRTTSVFYVDTLEYLRRGGRIGAAAALLGSALAVKPLLGIEEGRISTREKVRTSSRALGRLEEIAVATAGTQRVDVAVAHLANRERAEELAANLSRRLADNLAGRRLAVGEVGAVIGAHVGPGMVAVVVSPR